MGHQIEYAAAERGAHAEVLADLAALKVADANGELRAYRAQGHSYFRVLRQAAGRRVVPADDGNARAALRRTPGQRLAAYDAEQRERRPARAERECAPVLRQRRLEGAESAVYYDVVARFGSPILRPVR